MTTLADLTQQCRFLLQDVPDAGASLAWDDAQVRTALDAAALALARTEAIQDLVWVQAVADQRHYRLNAQNLCVATGQDSSGATGNLTTVTDATQDFTLTVVAGDRLRNFTDGSTGIITSIATTTLTCATGFTGGIDNAFDHRDAYGVERPLTQHIVTAVLTVLYDGIELEYASRDRLDRLDPGWERRARGPKYWTVDQAETPSVVTIIPPPALTGSSIPQFPMSPLAQRYEENLVLLVSHHTQQTGDGAESLGTLDVCHQGLVYDATARLAGFEGEWQHPSLATACKAMAALWWRLLGWPHG